MGAVADLELAIMSHQMLDQAIEAMTILLARSKHRRKGQHLRARGMLLVGYAGAGKSTIIQHFLDLNPPEQTLDGIVMPVAVVEVPPAPTLRATVDAIYAALGYRAEKALSAEDIVRDLTGKVDLLGVGAMLLDESHHILASRQSADVTEFLKSLLNRLGCSMIFAGLHELKDLRGSLQLSRRLFPDAVLRPYNFCNTAERLEFMSFLNALELHAIKLPEPSGLASQEMARRLYAASAGLLGIVTKYLSHALLLAHLRGLRCIDLDLLAEIDASWCGLAAAPDDIPFDNDISLDQGVDVAGLLAQVGRARIDVPSNPFKCDASLVFDIYKTRAAQQIVESPRRRLDRRMKGTGPDPQKAFQ
jgi:hypothetical protein